MNEKWNIEISHVRGSRKELVDDTLDCQIKESVHTGEGFVVDELEKNGIEKKSISDLNQAVIHFLRREGLMDLSVDEHTVHIVNPKVFATLQREETVEALFKEGHIYHPRIQNRMVLIRNLSHEFVHELSFLKQSVKLSTDEDDIFVDQYPSMRQGYAPTTAESRTYGKGFNEAMTELISLSILDEYVLANNPSKKDRAILFESISYYPHILVMQGLFKRINPDDPAKCRSLVFRGYFTGESEPLKKISDQLVREGIKDGLRMLYRMDTSLESALYTARYLQLEDTVKDIEQFIRESAST